MSDECEFDICDGSGYIAVEGDNPLYTDRKPCRCTLERAFKSKLGNEIYEAKKLGESKFSDLTDQNLFIKSNWSDFLPHLRYSLIGEGLDYFFRITNDLQLKDAWFSKQKTNSIEEGTIDSDYNSLRDVLEDPDLVVIRLGVVSYKNVSLPGILLESLKIRYFENKPTWVVNPLHVPFNDGHLCWSPDVESFVSNKYQNHKIQPENGERTHLHEGVVDEDEENKKGDDAIKNSGFGSLL